MHQTNHLKVRCCGFFLIFLFFPLFVCFGVSPPPSPLLKIFQNIFSHAGRAEESKNMEVSNANVSEEL